MITISNMNTARMYEMFLRDIKVTPKNHEVIMDIRRELRDFYNREKTPYADCTYIKKLKYSGYNTISNGFDGFTEILRFDTELYEDDIEYIDDLIRRDYRPTYYDCTGQWFTSWIMAYHLPGKTVIEHRVSCDI